jgi:hypothetical protein
MTLDLSHHGRARMNLPHGFVGLDVTADRLTLTVCRQHRHWWFWRRWRTHELASVPWRIKVNDTVQVMQAGETYVATVNDEVVLRWPPEPEVGRYRGFGMRAGGPC